MDECGSHGLRENRSRKFYHPPSVPQDVRAKSTACGGPCASLPSTIALALPDKTGATLPCISSISPPTDSSASTACPGCATEFARTASHLDSKARCSLPERASTCFSPALRRRIESFPGHAAADARFSATEVKRSWSATRPFKRLLVKIKREIVSMRRPEIDPLRAPAPRLAPQELKRWLDQGRDIVLLDTRNQFEVELGSFENTLALGLKSFSDFPRATAALADELKNRPVVTFCTGGIRCEKKPRPG